MVKNKNIILFNLMMLLAVCVIGCGGPSYTGGDIPVNTPAPTSNTPDVGPFLALTSYLDISSLNGKTIYSINSAEPTNKTERNYTDIHTPVYPFTLGTTILNSNAATNNRTLFPNNRLALMSGINNKKSSLDLILRDQENKLLKNKKSQITKFTHRQNSIVKSSIAVGSTWDNVNIKHTQNDSWVKINTTCKYISNCAYFFVDNRDLNAVEPKLPGYGSAFDRIYQVDHNKFGSENDVDGNNKIIVVLSEELSNGVLGYFIATDKYPQSESSEIEDLKYSNQGDIIYITTAFDGNYIYGALAHELQHMIYFDQHSKYDTPLFTWLNEALSQAAEYYSGYTANHLEWIKAFLEEGGYGGGTGLSLTCWTTYNYGYGAIFIRYLIDQYGDMAIKNMCSTDKVGISAVEAATGVDFNVIFNNFTRALVLDGINETVSPKYTFSSLDLKSIQPQGRRGLTPLPTIYQAGMSAVSHGGIYPYSIIFIKWTGNIQYMGLAGDSIVGTVFGLKE